MTWRVFDLAVSPGYGSDRTVYAGMNGGAIFRSQDSGVSWAPSGDGYPVGADGAQVEPSPFFEQDNTLFASGYGTGLYRSQDRGYSWSRIGLTGVYAIREIAISPGTALTEALILVGTEQEGVYRSEDGGASWTPITQGLAISKSHAIAFSPAYTQDQTIFVGADDGNGLHRSLDGGLNWTKLVTGLQGSYVWDVALSPDYAQDSTAFTVVSGDLYRSQDGGDSWTNLSFQSEYDVTQVAFSPNYAADQTVWVGTTQWKPDSEGGVFVSRDNGNTWQVVNLGLVDRDIRILEIADRGESSYDVFVGTRRRSVWQISVMDEITNIWTAMVYLNGDNNLDVQTEMLFNRLELALSHNPSLTVRVLWDRDGYGDTVLYDVQPDRRMYALANYVEGQTKWSQGERDMGSLTTLQDFILTSMQQLPAKYYWLSIVNHGGGWSPVLLDPQRNSERWAFGGSGFSWDEGNDYHYLSTKAMGAVLAHPTLVANPIDVVFYDACLMGMLEEAYEIRSGARYFVASENETWSSFPYDRYLEGIESRMPREQAIWIVDQYAASLSGYPRTMSAMDLQRVEPMRAALQNLAEKLYDSVPTYTQEISSALLSAQKYDYNYDLWITQREGYVDLGDLAARLSDEVTGTALADAAQQVLGVLQGGSQPMVIHEHHQSGSTGRYKTYMAVDDATGLSIYFPLDRSDPDLEFYTNGQLALAANTKWDEFIFYFAGVPYPQSYLDIVGGRGNQPYPPPPEWRVFLPITIKQ
jgi:photosystem II stability/assembly factor-like uncharacterized protein